MIPVYIRTVCAFCKKVLYADIRKLHGIASSDERDVIKEDNRKWKTKEAKIDSHFKQCKQFHAAVRAQIVPEDFRLTDSKVFVPKEFKSEDDR